jgi:hypothetical protein
MVRGDVDTSLGALEFDRRDVPDMTALGFSLHTCRNMDPSSVFPKPKYTAMYQPWKQGTF